MSEATVFFNYDKYLNEQRTFRITYDFSAQEIRITPGLQSGLNRSYYDNATFVFSRDRVLANRNLAPFWQTHACWGLECRTGNFSLGALHPVYAQTILHKAPFLTHTPLHPRPLLFYVPFASSPIEQIATLCYIHPKTSVETNVATERALSRASIEDRFLPKLEIDIQDQAGPDDVLRGEIRVLQAQGDVAKINEIVYLKTDAGYLSRTQVKIENGKGTFLFKPWLLEAGDVATIKAGFKHFSGKSRRQIHVV